MTGSSSESTEETPDSARTADFGFRRVDADEHRGLVGAVFDSVAGRYDLMNDLMSGGLHRVWRAALIDALDPRPGMRLLDVAGGTGDIAFRAIERIEERSAGTGEPGAVMICDPNEEMLGVARRRAIDRGLVAGISFVRAPAEALPLDDRTADACTISFGLRNVTDRAAALAEMHRTLAIGGHFLCLEFSPSVLPVLEPVYDAYSFRVLPWLGGIVADDRDAYRYLAESIRRFPAPEVLADELREAGFGNIRWRMFSGGIVALHSAWRI
jgi:demethylmenaquinone methyltransferase/2-methoxy-6-polyprenyl-1,4-benzoquinol methylase